MRKIKIESDFDAIVGGYINLVIMNGLSYATKNGITLFPNNKGMIALVPQYLINSLKDYINKYKYLSRQAMPYHSVQSSDTMVFMDGVAIMPSPTTKIIIYHKNFPSMGIKPFEVDIEIEFDLSKTI